MSIKVASEIIVYEINGIDALENGVYPKMLVKSHWAHDDRVELEIGTHTGPVRRTVLARDLIAAIQNARNTNND
jgi:hypothetical protein